MNTIQELRQRRVPQIVSAYVVAGWGALQFLAFLENRMTVSPNLVNLVGLTLVLLLPSVITMAWVHGRPGKDAWGRAPKFVIPANIVAVALLLVVLFHGMDLGAVTQTIDVQDENGAVVQRVVPKNEYRRRILVFYPEIAGTETWASESLAYLLSLDISQDIFIDVTLPLSMTGALTKAGSQDGHGLTRPLQRKLARDAHVPYFVTGTLALQDGKWQLVSELHESDSGKMVASRTAEAADLLILADQVSIQLRNDLGIPAAHIGESPDLPITEMTSADQQAVADHVMGLMKITHANDWEGAVPLLESAVERDEGFALAQFLLFAVRQSLGDAEGASSAIDIAMKNLYRVPERLSFVIKAQYYYNEKQDADKAIAVLRMWSQIYPNDVGAYDQLATFYFILQDLPAAIDAYEQILAIDPSRVKYLEELADLHTQLGNLDEAEKYLLSYVEFFPTRADGYEDLAQFYSRAGRLDDARQALEKAQLLDPDDQDLALRLVDLDIKIGKFNESEQALATMLNDAEIPRDRARILARQVQLAGVKGQPSRVYSGLEAFFVEMSAIQNPMQANLTYTMMLPALSMAGKPDLALSRIVEVKELIPAPYKDLAGVGQAWAYADLGQTTEARAHLAEAVTVVESFQFETFRSSIAVVEGMIDEAEGDLAEAVAHYREAIEKAIQLEPMYRIKLARALRLNGDDRQAREVLDEGLRVDPAHPEYQLEMAHLLEDQGNLAGSRTHLDAALLTWTDAEPEFRPAAEAREMAKLLKSP